MTNSKEFELAASLVKKLLQTPNNTELLYLYKYYKQATIGDNNVEKPPFYNVNDNAKWKAWDSLKGTSKHDSEVKYIQYVNELLNKYGANV